LEALVSPAIGAIKPDKIIRDDVVVIHVAGRRDAADQSRARSVGRAAGQPELRKFSSCARTRVAFIRGRWTGRIWWVAKVIDVMHTSGIASVGLLTPDLEKGLGQF